MVVADEERDVVMSVASNLNNAVCFSAGIGVLGRIVDAKIWSHAVDAYK